MKQNLLSYVKNIESTDATVASIMDENTFFDCINAIFHTHIFSFEELADAEIFQISVYEIPEGKKEFNIETVRLVSEKITLKPYEGKQIFVLKDFDTAGTPAQNAMLKLLEDCPSYAVIILLVKNPQKLLPTIISRVISLFHEENTFISKEIEDSLNQFFQGNIEKWISYLYQNEFTKDTAKTILMSVFSHIPPRAYNSLKQSIIHLESSNENPKKILETFFLCEDFFS